MKVAESGESKARAVESGWSKAKAIQRKHDCFIDDGRYQYANSYWLSSSWSMRIARVHFFGQPLLCFFLVEVVPYSSLEGSLSVDDWPRFGCL